MFDRRARGNTARIGVDVRSHREVDRQRIGVWFTGERTKSSAPYLNGCLVDRREDGLRCFDHLKCHRDDGVGVLSGQLRQTTDDHVGIADGFHLQPNKQNTRQLIFVEATDKTRTH